MSSEKERRQLEKRTKIIETAYQLFQTRSVNNTAIDDVVKACGIARGTFYLYFKDKSDLLDQLVAYKTTQYMKELLDRTSEKADSAAAITDRLRLFIDMYIDFLAEHKDVLAIVNKNVSACLRQFPDFYDPEVSEMYRKVVGGLGIPEAEMDNFQQKVYVMVDMIGSVCSDAIIYGQPYTLDEIRGCVTETALAVFTPVFADGGEEKA
ncbi:MAG: TetR/AcrR family transcriptional regulator [Clostridia bacterium]|nr:TetR/AcrR family transcriptional regulator [Clostridia bacterium]MBR0537506.1 TetR/AcrR family transcriptional regulator [Clostridia bacterium]